MKYTQYTIVARLFPALITALPIVVLYYFYLNTLLSGFIQSIILLRLAGEFSIGAALIYLYSQLNRFIGKLIEDEIFCDEENMPTTQLLLCGSMKYSMEYKDLLNKKVKKDFGLNFFSASEETNNYIGAKQRIVEIISLIRDKTRGSELLLQHNYEYGFIRNTVGGAIWGFITSVFNVYIFSKTFPSSTALNLSIVTTVTYLLLLILGVPLIKYAGNKYAKVLIQTYMSK
ncbi:MAG TPA: hypothetical protein VF209_03940 [Patescibacteria group bacterium]